MSAIQCASVSSFDFADFRSCLRVKLYSSLRRDWGRLSCDLGMCLSSFLTIASLCCSLKIALNCNYLRHIKISLLYIVPIDRAAAYAEFLCKFRIGGRTTELDRKSVV